MCCVCCRPDVSHDVGAVVMVGVGVGSIGLALVLAGMWLAGVIVVVAPYLAALLIAAVALEVAVPVYYVIRDAGPMPPSMFAREVRRAIANDVTRIRLNRARRRAALEASRAPIATPYAIPNRTEEVARGRQ